MLDSDRAIALCPICRTRLTKNDVHDAMGKEEADALRGRTTIVGNYGTKASCTAL